MKKALLLLIPLMIFISCEDKKEDTPGDTTPASLVGTWSIVSATEYENGDCSGEGQNIDITGTATFTETGEALINITQNLSFSDFCVDWYDGEMVDDTTCSFYGGYVSIEEYAGLCYEIGGDSWGGGDDQSCVFYWAEEYDYTYDMETSVYCEIDYAATDSSETTCGTAVVTENSATLQIPGYDEDDECFSFVLSR